MDKLRWSFGMRYELSADGKGLLKYFSQTDFYHIHSDEMTSLERWKHRALTANKGKVQFSI
jgi:hypothetical protein